MAFVSKSLGIALAVCLVAGCASSSSSSSSGTAAWDQARVTALAQQLVGATTEWQAAVLRQPEAGIRLQTNARTLFDQSTTLAAHLAKGKDRSQTLDYYRGLKEATDDTEQLNQRTPFDELSQGTWAKVADLMGQLASYYGT